MERDSETQEERRIEEKRREEVEKETQERLCGIEKALKDITSLIMKSQESQE